MQRDVFIKMYVNKDIMTFNLPSVLLLVLLLSISNLLAQDSIPRKSIHAVRISTPPKIDGVLDEEVWNNATVASGFVERMPTNGRAIPDSLHTEVKILYDDKGIYFGAVMNDPSPELILKELTERDGIGNDDFFFILLNGYNDRQQSLQFIITAAGVQYDAKMTNGKEDSSWTAVWVSAVDINEHGWVAEIFIPYSEVRFPEGDIQVWGLNMEREFRRARTRYSWNHVDNTKGAFSIYDGEIHGIKDIKTPTRLAFQPYVSTYINSYDKTTDVTTNAGMDIKYGINDGFTLDMILIPDFGQTKFDNTILNLSAFEVQYAEQRPFFTEGTELFSIGNLFYSRRVGDFPTGYPSLKTNEVISDFPAKVSLLNAMKVSGRTKNGLGIGVFNAVTESANARILDTLTGIYRKEQVEPYANYNVLVFDKRFGQNNSVSFVNTNVLREGSGRDANVSGLYANITNKENTWYYQGNIEGSWTQSDKSKFGLEASAGTSKISGQHRYQASIFLRTKDYDIDDLGYTGRTNYINYYGYYGYRYLKPRGILNTMFLNFNLNYNRRLEPSLYNNFNFNFNSSFTTKSFYSFGGGFESSIFETNDIYEPRTFGRHVKVPAFYSGWLWFATDYRKKFTLSEVYVDWLVYDQKNRDRLTMAVEPRYRFSDKWKLFYRSELTMHRREPGYVSRNESEIYFGERNRNTFENRLESQYIFNNRMALSFAFRHYYAEVDYNRYFNLETNGELTENSSYSAQHDATYNSWNVDLRFSWWFAPGSQLSILYRNAIESYDLVSGMNFSDNFTHLFDQSQLNSVSIRINYFLDYNRMRGWLKKPTIEKSDDSMVYFSKGKNKGRNGQFLN